jgi:hypothetical protein
MLMTLCDPDRIVGTNYLPYIASDSQYSFREYEMCFIALDSRVQASAGTMSNYLVPAGCSEIFIPRWPGFEHAAEISRLAWDIRTALSRTGTERKIGSRSHRYTTEN